MSYNYDIQDMELTSIAVPQDTEHPTGKVLQLSEAGGSESAHIVIEVPKPTNGGSATAKVQHCDTPDGEFTDTELTYEGSATEDTEKRWRIPLDMKRYIRLHVEGTSDAAVRLTVRV